MTVRVYSHETAAVPWTYGANGYPMLKAILVGCLVTGTGGIPGAGWSVVADSGGATGYFVLRNAAADLFICFSYVSVAFTKVSMARTYGGVDSNGFIIGEGARSGYQPGFTAYQRFSTQNLGGSAAGGQAGWCVVADGAAFAFTSSAASAAAYSGATMDTTASALAQPGQTLGSGRTSKGLAYIAGGWISDATFAGLDFNCTYIESPATGLLIPSTDSIAAPELSVRTGVLGHSTDTSEFVYEDLPSIEGRQHVARLGDLGLVKGFLFMPTVQQGYYRHVLRRLGMAPNFDTMQPKDIAKAIVSSDGHTYAYCKTTISSAQGAHATPCLVTNNPRVW